MVIKRLGSYAEVSPSDTGAKVYALIGDAALTEVRTLTGISSGRSFARRDNAGPEHPEAIEIFVERRYFAYTGLRLDDTPAELAVIAPDVLIWLLTDFAPAFVGTTTKTETVTSPNHRQ